MQSWGHVAAAAVVFSLILGVGAVQACRLVSLIRGGAVQAWSRSNNTKATMTLRYDGPAHRACRSRYQC